jgi:hypothetical protein
MMTLGTGKYFPLLDCSRGIAPVYKSGCFLCETLEPTRAMKAVSINLVIFFLSLALFAPCLFAAPVDELGSLYK